MYSAGSQPNFTLELAATSCSLDVEKSTERTRPLLAEAVPSVTTTMMYPSTLDPSGELPESMLPGFVFLRLTCSSASVGGTNHES